MSPEYAIDGQFSVKSDVFSFGVLVLEILSGRRNREFYHPDHDLNLLGHVSLFNYSLFLIYFLLLEYLRRVLSGHSLRNCDSRQVLSGHSLRNCDSFVNCLLRTISHPLVWSEDTYFSFLPYTEWVWLRQVNCDRHGSCGMKEGP